MFVQSVQLRCDVCGVMSPLFEVLNFKPGVLPVGWARVVAYGAARSKPSAGGAQHVCSLACRDALNVELSGRVLRLVGEESLPVVTTVPVLVSGGPTREELEELVRSFVGSRWDREDMCRIVGLVPVPLFDARAGYDLFCQGRMCFTDVVEGLLTVLHSRVGFGGYYRLWAELAAVVGVGWFGLALPGGGRSLIDEDRLVVVNRLYGLVSGASVVGVADWARFAGALGGAPDVFVALALKWFISTRSS